LRKGCQVSQQKGRFESPQETVGKMAHAAGKGGRIMSRRKKCRRKINTGKKRFCCASSGKKEIDLSTMSLKKGERRGKQKAFAVWRKSLKKGKGRSIRGSLAKKGKLEFKKKGGPFG